MPFAQYWKDFSKIREIKYKVETFEDKNKFEKQNTIFLYITSLVKMSANDNIMEVQYAQKVNYFNDESQFLNSIWQIVTEFLDGALYDNDKTHGILYGSKLHQILG